MPRFFLQDFGCRATQADGAALRALLERQGFDGARTAGEAELVVLNTCTVTGSADEEVRKRILRLHRENPAVRILVTGCYAQRSPEELARLPGVDWVVGNSHKTKIPDILRGMLGERAGPAATGSGAAGGASGAIHVGDLAAERGFLPVPLADPAGDRTRPLLKIQEGCSNACTFCVIPAVRGSGRSMSLEEVLAAVRALAANHAEIVLTGINLGHWGREPGLRAEPRVRFSGLLRRALDTTEVRRVRLSSIEPLDWSDELLELMAGDERICRHVHMPLQSGCDGVLKRMKRRYRVRHYEERLRRAHALMPDAAFGADVMAGFPGESDAEFLETYALIERLPLTYLHVFPYSPRPNTPAAALAPVDARVRGERTRRLIELGERKSRAFRERMRGRTLSAVALGNATAITTNYIAVELARPRERGALIHVCVGGLTRRGAVEAGALRVLPS